ncbi:hypothetical protein I5E68_18280 [Novosphingobium sp. YJ-S2-02]|uniref:Uncharacterized protein n=1 Tax=Novosphingobium aureum TaxID=2792964 RepID=A0A931HGF5_9SPHN|nr:hypothetical protein [Novosphingobium aureum]MBH0114899.1 hypothetical protein [Novosphingobium aureum]
MLAPHTRAIVAATAFALVTGKKVAGLYDHTAARDLRVAAEARDNAVQGVDAESGTKFGGTLPDILVAKERTWISFALENGEVTGYDRASATHFTARVENGAVQVYDHAGATWFAYEVQDASAPQSYYREA